MVRQSLQSLAAMRGPPGRHPSAASGALLNRGMRLGRGRQRLVLEALPSLAEDYALSTLAWAHWNRWSRLNHAAARRAAYL
jgi:hypothetical protein